MAKQDKWAMINIILNILRTYMGRDTVPSDLNPYGNSRVSIVDGEFYIDADWFRDWWNETKGSK